ncbi:MAG: NADPH-dependent FMN reductase, partial [Pseudomonadota bacterium]
MKRLLGISGSLRRESFNTKLVHEAFRQYGACEANVADLNLPLYNQDVEDEGMPAPVTALKEQVEAADALIIATPEYNKNPPGVLKNALDWLSRFRPMPTAGKPTVILSATAGGAGGQRAQSALYLMLVPFDVDVLANPEVFVGAAHTKFGEDGTMSDQATADFLAKKMALLRA